MHVFGIFEGGGPKGLAHIGALKASEERHVEFCGVAGASAGAIVAALIAVGYKADDLYNPNGRPKGEFDVRFLDLLDESKTERDARWRGAQALFRMSKNHFEARDQYDYGWRPPAFTLGIGKYSSSSPTNGGYFRPSILGSG